jgi:hypothetical protein
METEHFKDKELACPCCGVNGMNKEFLERLECLRLSYDKPLIINSAYRCQKHNDELPNSSPVSLHLRGLAVDIHVPYSQKRFKLVDIAIVTRFNRIGLAKTFIHLGIDPDKSKKAMWVY